MFQCLPKLCQIVTNLFSVQHHHFRCINESECNSRERWKQKISWTSICNLCQGALLQITSKFELNFELRNQRMATHTRVNYEWRSLVHSVSERVCRVGTFWEQKNCI